MPRTAAPSTNPRILSGYAPYSTQSSTDSKSKGTGSPSTTEERRQLLLRDPHARDVQPEQVTCVRCAKTVRLQKGKKYHLAHWLDHRWRCEKATAADPQPRAKCRSLPERRKILEEDPDVRNIEADRVVCGKCNNEVKFRKGRPYALSSWNQHKLSCPANAPSVAPSSASSHSPTPEPPNALSSDPLVASLDAHRVKCALCLAWIDMGLQTDIDVHVWRRHRASCVAENFADDKLGWARPRFFRPRHHLSDQNSHLHSRHSPEAEHTPKACLKIDQSRDHASSTGSRTTAPSPPPLSFSTATSAATSAAPTPINSPRRTPSLVTASSPRPQYTPLSLSRFERERDDVHTGDDDQPLSGTLELHSGQDQSPPYLQRTHLSLPIPKRYWRFETIE